VNISKLHHMLESNHSTFYVRSIQVSFPYKFLVLKMQTLLTTQNVWKTVTFHCLSSLRWHALYLPCASRQVEPYGQMFPFIKTPSNCLQCVLERLHPQWHVKPFDATLNCSNRWTHTNFSTFHAIQIQTVTVKKLI
jgi:hypothetical protein